MDGTSVNNGYRDLCLSLMQAETEAEVVSTLRDSGYWDDPACWRFFDDNDGNYSTIGNQQSRPEAALVEKIVNSIDARLLNACLSVGVDPESEDAPKSIREAVATFFESASMGPESGRVKYWPAAKRTEQGRLITVAATGNKPPGNATYSIADAGEGQRPSMFPHTFLSLNRGNKLRIPFVQGKFNMGGTGALRFCGKMNLQLIVSRRNPEFGEHSSHEGDDCWGFTVVRREDPSSKRRSSVYTYLALGDEDETGARGVPFFHAETLPIFPDGQNPHGRAATHGTLTKLYEYESRGFRSNIITTRTSLLRLLDFLLPEVALPVRLYECRPYSGHSGSFETNLTGISVRLDDEKQDNLEPGFPTSGEIAVRSEQMDVTIYAFKKERAETYKSKEGVSFVVNGQSHGQIGEDFFRKRKVGLSYLANSLLVLVDCSNISGRAREDLFMNSRDRLQNGELRRDIESALEELLGLHAGLRELRERRRREDIAEKLMDSKPLEDVLKDIMKKSPSLASLFLSGSKLKNPFRSLFVAGDERKFEGKRFPTVFKFRDLAYGAELTKPCHHGSRARVFFETDAENDYFSRELDTGQFELLIRRSAYHEPVTNYVLNLHDGIASLSVELPADADVGDVVTFVTRVSDTSTIDPFENVFRLAVGEPAVRRTGREGTRRQPPSKKKGHEREIPDSLELPVVTEIAENEWHKQNFDKYSALSIVHAGQDEDDSTPGAGSYDFFVNVDNVHLRAEQKVSKEDPAVLKARYKYGLVLIGLALLNDDLQKKASADEEDEADVESLVRQVTRSISPVLLPLIEYMGALETDESAA